MQVAFPLPNWLESIKARFTNKQDDAPTVEHDDLGWAEKIPLALALIAQSYVIFNWYFRSVKGIHINVDFVVAIAAGIALDLIVVTTTMGRRQGRESKWSHATAFGAFVCSALIALNVYGAIPWIPEGWLHIAFPLEVWLYSQHLATPKRRRQSAQMAAVATVLEPVAPPPAPEQPVHEPKPTPAPQPDPDTDIDFSPAPLDPVGLPDWLTGEGEEQHEAEQEEEPVAGAGLPLSRRVVAILSNRPHLKDEDLYNLLPGENPKSIRVYSSKWRKNHPELLAVATPNGKH